MADFSKKSGGQPPGPVIIPLKFTLTPVLEARMTRHEETAATIRGRLDVLSKGLISEENSVQYYQTLIDKGTAEDEEQEGRLRMFADLKAEEEKHVQRFRELIEFWQNKLKELESAS